MFSTKNDFDPQGLHYTPVLPHPNLAVIDAIRELMREMGAAYARIHLGLCGWSDWEPSSLLVHALLILDTPISAGYFECLTDSAHSEAAAFVGRHPRWQSLSMRGMAYNPFAQVGQGALGSL